MEQQPDKGTQNNPSQQQPGKGQTPEKGPNPTPEQQSPDKQDIPDEIPEREIKHTPANPQDRESGNQ